jgi:hypothetical protein
MDANPGGSTNLIPLCGQCKPNLGSLLEFETQLWQLSTTTALLMCMQADTRGATRSARLRPHRRPHRERRCVGLLARMN